MKRKVISRIPCPSLHSAKAVHAQMLVAGKDAHIVMPRRGEWVVEVIEKTNKKANQ